MIDHKIDMPGGEHAVLLIHGMTGSPFELKPLAKKLNKAGFAVKGPLLGGHGGPIDTLKGARWQDWYSTIHAAFKEMKKEHKTVSVSGLCAGALMALYLAYEEKEDVSAVSLLSTTLFYDGWSLPWYRFLLPVSYYPPIKYFYSYQEREPYGIKDERMRKQVALGLKESEIAYPEFPAQCIHELFKLIRVSKKILPAVTAPALILHAEEDDLASARNADYVEKHIGSKDVRKVFVKDSYHMLTLDRQKDFVAQETISFFKARCEAARPQPVQATV